MVNNFCQQLLDGVFPHYCALCGLRSHTAVPLCRGCEADLRDNRHCCVRCAIPLPASDTADTARQCGNCLHAPPPWDRALCPWLYGEYFAHLIHQWKFQRERRLTPLLAYLWLQQAVVRSPVDVLVPVPLHWRKRWHRGFNQSELLARQLLTSSPALQHSKLELTLVKRTQQTAPQSGMTAHERVDNLHGAFTVCKPCDNLRVAIVDDVLTTGATATALANVLARAGASYIEVWCLARTPAPGL